jgi:hypothetical protein
MNLYFFKNQLEIPAAMVDIILRARVSMEEWLFKMNQNSRLDSETRKKRKEKRGKGSPTCSQGLHNVPFQVSSRQP